MTALHALLLGIVEGLTEFLPVSSTAHLIIVSNLLKLPATEFQKTFEIAIQLGAIFAVCVLYWRTFLRDRDVLMKVLVAFIPTAVVGLLLEKIIKNILFESLRTILGSLFLGGIVIILFEYLHKPRSDAAVAVRNISFPQAFGIGCAQALAVVPGVSRSAATVLGGEALGLTRRAAVDFSFMLAVPSMAAATALDLLHSADAFSSANIGLLAIGFMTCFVVALGTIHWLIGFVKNHSFAPFGVYRVGVAVVLFLLWVRSA